MKSRTTRTKTIGTITAIKIFWHFCACVLAFRPPLRDRMWDICVSSSLEKIQLARVAMFSSVSCQVPILYHFQDQIKRSLQILTCSHSSSH